MVLPGTRSLKRPSCGTRFSAMSSSAITLMREMIELWKRLAIGRIAGCSTPSMRYFTCTASSCVSMWMSLARRWMAVKIVESTSRMIGLMSLVSRSTVRLSSPTSSSLSSWIWNSSVASSSTRCELSLFLRIDSIAERAPTITRDRRAEQHAQLVDHRQVGRIRHDDDDAPCRRGGTARSRSAASGRPESTGTAPGRSGTGSCRGTRAGSARPAGAPAPPRRCAASAVAVADRLLVGQRRRVERLLRVLVVRAMLTVLQSPRSARRAADTAPARWPR